MCDKSRNTWLCVHWQWNTLEWCQLNALQASPVVHLVTPLSCVSLSMNTQPSVPAIETHTQMTTKYPKSFWNNMFAIFKQCDEWNKLSVSYRPLASQINEIWYDTDLAVDDPMPDVMLVVIHQAKARCNSDVMLTSDDWRCHNVDRICLTRIPDIML